MYSVGGQISKRPPAHPTSFLLGSDSLPPALGPETRPVSPPSPLEVPTLKAPKPKVDLPWSPGDLMEKGKGRWPEGLGEVASVGLQWLSLPLQKSWQGA